MFRNLDRPRLVERVGRALKTGHVFLTAPTGYGKTILLQLLTQHRPDTYLLRLTPADVDLAQLRPRLEPLLQPGHTVLLDDVQMLEDSRAACDWLRACLVAPGPRFVLAGQLIPSGLSWLQASNSFTVFRQDDLAVAPSASTRWLRERLERGEEI